MKKIVYAFLILTFAVVVGVIVGKILQIEREAKKSKPAKLLPAQVQTASKKNTNRFIWGAQGGPYALNNIKDGYIKENIDLQIAKVKELNMNLIRANLEFQTKQNPYFIKYSEFDNDNYIKAVTDAGLDLLLVLDPNVPSTVGKTDYYQEGYKMGTYAAKRYKGKIKYYQLANEISGTIVKKEETKGDLIKGENGIDYSKEMYDVTLAWIKGMAKGIRENDPQAKIVLSGHWILYDIFPKMISDGADFDILGWSWYSSDGTDPTKREYNYGNYMNLAKKLASIKKEVWIVEANRSGGSLNDNNMTSEQGEQAQADFFNAIMPNIYNSKYFKGFIVYTLFDNVVARVRGNDHDSHFGLIETEIINEKVKVKKNKKSFDVLKNYIATHL